MQDKIIVKGARANNLKNIDVTIPRDKLVVMTGLSGSGKSSLAFDTIYAEGQRRYVESLSSYARMFLGQMDKPDVDYIEGLSPAISIDQKTTSKNPRSTVGTVTEIYDYLRLLWARIGTPHCPKCGKEIRQQTIDQIIDQVMALPEPSSRQRRKAYHTSSGSAGAEKSRAKQARSPSMPEKEAFSSCRRPENSCWRIKAQCVKPSAARGRQRRAIWEPQTAAPNGVLQSGWRGSNTKGSRMGATPL